MSVNFFLNVIQFVLAVSCALSTPYLPTTTVEFPENIKVEDDTPHETQHAVCKVFTKEIEATAKATITRQLKGVCSSTDLNSKFDVLQQDLQQIKQALGLHRHNTQYKNLDFGTKKPSGTTSTSEMPTYEYLDYVQNEDAIKKETGQKLKHITSNLLPNKAKLQHEISTFNDTIVESSEGDLYFYYWRIPDINQVLKRKDIYISSPAFSVLGHTLYLQFYPNYQDDYIGILLKPDSTSFLKKHKIIYLGQRSTQNQISSGVLYGIKKEDKIFKIESKMLTNYFISSENLLVKIKIYLNS